MKLASSQGLGLGLSVSRDLCALIGGVLSVESEFGKGTTFKLTIPLAGPHPKSLETALAGQSGGRSETSNEA